MEITAHRQFALLAACSLLLFVQVYYELTELFFNLEQLNFMLHNLFSRVLNHLKVLFTILLFINKCIH